MFINILKLTKPERYRYKNNNFVNYLWKVSFSWNLINTIIILETFYMGFLLIIKKYLLKEALDSVAIIDSPTFFFQKSNSILCILELLSTHPKQFQILDKTKKISLFGWNCSKI